MSHRGQGTHGAWRNQDITSFSRMSMLHGHKQAWRVFIGVELPKLPPVPDVIAGERRLAQQARASAVRAAKATYNKRRKALERAHRRGLLSAQEFYRYDDDAYAKCNALIDAAERDFADAVRGLDAMAVTHV